jgi:PmbA protein
MRWNTHTSTSIAEEAISAIKKEGLCGKINIASTKTDAIMLKAGRIKEASGGKNIQFTITVLDRGRLGQARGNRKENAASLVERAKELAFSGKPAHFEDWPGPGEYEEVKLYSQKTARLSREDMSEKLQAATDKLLSCNADLYLEGKGELIEQSEITATTGGIFNETTRSRWLLLLSSQLTRGDDILHCYARRSWGDVTEYFDAGAMAEEIIEDITLAEKTAAIASGTYPVIFDCTISGMLFHGIGEGTNGRNVFEKRSPLCGKIGKPVLAQSITLSDRPHINFCPASAVYDDDGVPTREYTVIENGKLCRFLYDLDTAGRTDTPPTGNDRCNPYFLQLERGKTSFASMLENITTGVYIKDLMGFGQSNIINGDYSANIGLGYKIENGKLTGRIKNTMISGNFYEQFAGNVTVGSETDPAGLNPYVMVEAADISSK